MEAAGEAIPSALADCTSYLLRQVFLRASRAALNALPGGMHPRDVVVLGAIAEQDALSQHDLAGRLGINRTIMVKLIDKLEGAGYVARRRNPEDRRSYVLSVTASGRRVMEKMVPARAGTGTPL